jgi:hypothetical protein
VTRWKAALRVLWRTEPALALALYFLLAAASAGYVDLAGGHLASSLGTLTTRYMSIGGIAVYAFFTWRMWLGGGISWTLSVMLKLLCVVVTAIACYRAPGPFVVGLLALTLGSLVPLFAPAVLDRVSDRSYKFAPLRGVRSAFVAGYAGYQGPPRHGGPLPTGSRDGAAV